MDLPRSINDLHENYRPLRQHVFRRERRQNSTSVGNSSLVGEAHVGHGLDSESLRLCGGSRNINVAKALVSQAERRARGAVNNCCGTQVHSSVPPDTFSTASSRSSKEAGANESSTALAEISLESKSTTASAYRLTESPRKKKEGGKRRKHVLIGGGNSTWEDALRTLELCLEAGADIHEPLAVLAEQAMITLHAVQRYRAQIESAVKHQKVESRVQAELGGAAPSSAGKATKGEIDATGEEGDKGFPSWSVRSRLVRSDKSRNYIRLPDHVLAQNGGTSDAPHEGASQPAGAADIAARAESPPAPEIPSFLTSRALSDALLLVSGTEAASVPSIVRDATVLQCVLDLLEVPSGAVVTSRASGVKPSNVLIAEARRREIAQIVDKHRTALMSHEVVTRLTRLEHRNGRWVGALRLLQHTLLDPSAKHVGALKQTSSSTVDSNPSSAASKHKSIAISPAVPLSSPMISTGIEVFAAAKKWEVALELINMLPGRLWRETDVNSVIKSLSQSRAPEGWRHALRIFEEAAGEHRVKMTAATHVNHLLGLLARENKTDEAARIVERYIKLEPSLTSSSSERSFTTAGRNYYDRGRDGSAETEATTKASSDSCDVSDESKVEANAYTISQICVAFRSQWSRALSYASAIIARNKSNPAIVDGVALAKLTMAATEGNCWEHGLEIVRISEETKTPLDPASYAAIAKLIEGSDGGLVSTVEAKREHSAFVSACVRRHHSPAVFAKVLNTMIQTSPLGSEKKMPIRDNAGPNTTPVMPVEDEDHHCQGDSPNSTSSQFASKIGTSNGAEVLSMHYTALVQNGCHVETASLQRLLEAHCRNGDWAEGLHFLSLLRERGHVTSAGHDAVQYAMLEPRPSVPQPSWRLAVELYDSMTTISMDPDANPGGVKDAATGSVAFAAVPLSEIAFRSCIRLCFQQGAADAAQKLLRSTMRRGISSSFRK